MSIIISGRRGAGEQYLPFKLPEVKIGSRELAVAAVAGGILCAGGMLWLQFSLIRSVAIGGVCSLGSYGLGQALQGAFHDDTQKEDAAEAIAPKQEPKEEPAPAVETPKIKVEPQDEAVAADAVDEANEHEEPIEVSDDEDEPAPKFPLRYPDRYRINLSHEQERRFRRLFREAPRLYDTFLESLVRGSASDIENSDTRIGLDLCRIIGGEYPGEHLSTSSIWAATELIDSEMGFLRTHADDATAITNATMPMYAEHFINGVSTSFRPLNPSKLCDHQGFKLAGSSKSKENQRDPKGIRRILVPFNAKESHWYFYEIDLVTKRIVSHNSILGYSDDEKFLSYTPYFEAFIEEYGIPTTDKKWELIVNNKYPQQPNGNDCGFYTCQGIYNIVTGKDEPFTDPRMSYLNRLLDRSEALLEALNERVIEVED